MGICAILFPNLLLNLYTNQENAANIESATYDCYFIFMSLVEWIVKKLTNKYISTCFLLTFY